MSDQLQELIDALISETEKIKNGPMIMEFGIMEYPAGKIEGLRIAIMKAKEIMGE